MSACQPSLSCRHVHGHRLSLTVPLDASSDCYVSIAANKPPEQDSPAGSCTHTANSAVQDIIVTLSTAFLHTVIMVLVAVVLCFGYHCSKHFADPAVLLSHCRRHACMHHVTVDVLLTGRCAVCTIQRKGKCGSLSAPSKCRRKKVLAVRRQIQVCNPSTMSITGCASCRQQDAALLYQVCMREVSIQRPGKPAYMHCRVWVCQRPGRHIARRQLGGISACFATLHDSEGL